MKKLLLAGIVMVFAAGLFAETLTLTGTVKSRTYIKKKTGEEATNYSLSTDEYKTVKFQGKSRKDVAELVGETVTMEVEGTVKEGKKGKIVTVKKILEMK